MSRTRRRRPLLLLTAATLAAAGALLCALCFREAWRMVGENHPGFFVHRNALVHAGTNALREDLPLQAFDIVLAADGRPVQSGGQVLERARGVPPGTEIRYRVQRGGRELELAVPTARFTLEDFTVYFFVFFIVGALFLALGVALLFLRPGNRLSCAAALFNIDLGLILVTQFSKINGGAFSLLNVCLMVLLAFAWLEFTTHIGARPPWSHTQKALCYGALLAMSCLFLFHYHDWRWTFFNAYAALFFILSAALLTRFVLFLFEKKRISDPRQRRVILLMPVMGLVCLSPPIVAKVLTVLFGLALPVDLTFLSIVIFPALMTYAAARYNLFDLDRVPSRRLTSMAILIPVMGVYLLLVNVLNLFVLREGVDSRSLFVAYLILLVLLFKATQTQTQRLLDRILFPSRVRYRDAVREAGAALSVATEPEAVARVLEAGVREILEPSRVRLLLQGDGGAYAQVAPEAPPGDPAIPEPGPAVRRFLETRRDALTRRDAEKARCQGLPGFLAALGAELLFPLRPETGPGGLLVLGAKRYGGLYTGEDVSLLGTLAGQASLGLANAAAFRELRSLGLGLERRSEEVEQQREKIAELQRRLAEENVYLREAAHRRVEGFEQIVGESRALREALEVARRAAATDSTVLITGETGTGKELVARAIHELGGRKERILVRMNCAAVPAGLVESELFGHEKGAFTDAVKSRKGRFELADGGSLFLDEVGELPAEAQVKLLRVLQERELERVGGNRVVRVDVRVLAATNRDLREMVRTGRFREDLFWRLNVVEVRLPPLRERRQDIPLLVRHFIDRYNGEMRRRIVSIQEEAMRLLTAYPWPGNVRELSNVMERAVVLAQGPKLTLEHLPAEVVRSEEPEGGDTPFPLADYLERQKRKAVERALRKAGGNKARAARMLGLDPSNFSKLLRKMDGAAGP